MEETADAQNDKKGNSPDRKNQSKLGGNRRLQNQHALFRRNPAKSLVFKRATYATPAANQQNAERPKLMKLASGTFKKMQENSKTQWNLVEQAKKN